MTAAGLNVSNPGFGGEWVKGPQSAGTTTLLRRLVAEMAVDERTRTDPTVRSLLQTDAGAQS